MHAIVPSNRAQEFESNVEAMKVEFSERNIQAQERLATLDRQIAEFRSHSEGTTQGVMADTDNIKVKSYKLFQRKAYSKVLVNIILYKLYSCDLFLDKLPRSRTNGQEFENRSDRYYIS